MQATIPHMDPMCIFVGSKIDIYLLLSTFQISVSLLIVKCSPWNTVLGMRSFPGEMACFQGQTCCYKWRVLPVGPKVDMYKWSYFFEQRTHNLVNGTQKISIDLLLKKAILSNPMAEKWFDLTYFDWNHEIFAKATCEVFDNSYKCHLKWVTG